MKKFLLTLVALVVACTVPHMGQAKTIESTLFTCKGELSKMADQYVITHEEEDNNLHSATSRINLFDAFWLSATWVILVP